METWYVARWGCCRGGARSNRRPGCAFRLVSHQTNAKHKFERRETELVRQPSYGAAGLHTLLGQKAPPSPMHPGPLSTRRPVSRGDSPGSRLRRLRGAGSRRKRQGGMITGMRGWKPSGKQVPRQPMVSWRWASTHTLPPDIVAEFLLQSVLVGESELALKFAVGSPLEPSEMLSTVYGAWSKSLGLAPGNTATDPGATAFAAGVSPAAMMFDSPTSFGPRALGAARRGQSVTPASAMDSARTRSPFAPAGVPQVTLSTPPVGRFRRMSLESDITAGEAPPSSRVPAVQAKTTTRGKLAAGGAGHAASPDAQSPGVRGWSCVLAAVT